MKCSTKENLRRTQGATCADDKQNARRTHNTLTSNARAASIPRNEAQRRALTLRFFMVSPFIRLFFVNFFFVPMSFLSLVLMRCSSLFYSTLETAMTRTGNHVSRTVFFGLLADSQNPPSAEHLCATVHQNLL
jgi:hypothetical protein